MTVSQLIVVVVVIALAAGLTWWFFGPKPETRAAVGGGLAEVKVTVRGGYSPSRIRARAGVPLRLLFDRQETGDCTSRVVFADFGINQELPAFATTAVTIHPERPGEYGFACGMDMVHGVLVVEEGDGRPQTADGPHATGAAALADSAPDSDQQSGETGQARAQEGFQEVTLVVGGGYDPSRILARAGVPVRLVVDLREDGACSAILVVPDLGVSAELAPFAPTVLELPALSVGEHPFQCGMGMLHGSLVATAEELPRAEPARTTASHFAEPAEGLRAGAASSRVLPPMVYDGTSRPQRGDGAGEADPERWPSAGRSLQHGVGQPQAPQRDLDLPRAQPQIGPRGVIDRRRRLAQAVCGVPSRSGLPSNARPSEGHPVSSGTWSLFSTTDSS